MVRRIMEWLLMFWKTVLREFEKVAAKFRAKPGVHVSRRPSEPVPGEKKEPYRSAEPAPVPAVPVPKDDPKLVCTLTGEASRSLETVNKLKEKTKRRALRHFNGKEVRHRVTAKKPDSIEFAFFRRSGTPLKIRWQKPTATQPNT